MESIIYRNLTPVSFTGPRTKVGNTPFQGKDTCTDICSSEKGILSHASQQAICKACKKLSLEGLWPLFAFDQLSESKPSRICILEAIDRRNRRRQGMGGSRLSHSQIDEAMKYVSRFQ